MTKLVQPPAECLASDIVRLEQEIPFDVRTQRYKENQTAHQIVVPRLFQVAPVDLHVQEPDPVIVSGGHLVHVALLKQFMSPGLNQEVQFADHSVLIKKIVFFKDQLAYLRGGWDV